MRFVVFAAIGALVALSSGGPSALAAPATIVVTSAWSRPVPAGLPTGVIYLTIGNLGHDPDRLIGAKSPVAARLTLHRSAMVQGMMSMGAVPAGAEIAPGGVLKLEPGGYHLMLQGLNRQLAPGDRFPTTLTFAHAGDVRIMVQVRTGPPPTVR